MSFSHGRGLVAFRRTDVGETEVTDGELFAVRQGPWKLHFKTQSEFGRGLGKHDPPLLFHLERDPSEKYNVAKEHPDVIAGVLKEVERHKADLKPGKPQT